MAQHAQDLPGALNARRDMLAIAADPALDASAKLFAFCLLAHLTALRQAGHRGGVNRDSWATAVGEMMYPPDSFERKHYGPIGICRRIIAADIPRYELARVPAESIQCQTPKSRGPDAGKPCSKPGVGHPVIDYDPDTGQTRWIAYCRNHSHPSLDEWRHKRRQAWEDNGRPSPPPNTGGVLARHFATDWDVLYEWAADPSRTLLPEDNPPTPPQPKFTLIQGGAEGDPAGRQRPGREALKVCDATGQ